MMQTICPLAAAEPIKLSHLTWTHEKERERKEFSSGLHVWVGCEGGILRCFKKSLVQSRVGCDHTNHWKGGERRIISRENDWLVPLSLQLRVQERERAIGLAV